MKKENIKESINATRKESTLNIDYTSVLIDKTLQESASIMYIRQATYYFLLRLNGWTRTDLHKAIKTRSQVTSTPYNKGVLVKESAVALYCMEKESSVFSGVKINKKDFEKVINKIALLMEKNKLSYNYLKDKIKQQNPKESEAEAQDSAESEAETQDSKESTLTSLQAVIDFINNTTQENRLKIADVLASAIKQNAIKKAA